MRELDVNVAADFIYMAAVLIHIKSKMLLPRDPLAPADAQDDPRSELVNRLLEHEKFKAAAQMLLQKQQIEDAVWSNPSLKDFKDAEGTEPELAADVIDLVKTFQQILDRARSRPILQVDEETVAEQHRVSTGAGVYVPGDAGTRALAGGATTARTHVRRNSDPQARRFRRDHERTGGGKG
jgi:chromatin segregation and condensation protein Rec8/ScpA/Scc1 (kleisin family)